MSDNLLVVVGAAKPGIGRAVTRRLLAEGKQVIGTFEPGDEEHATQLRQDFGNRITLTQVDPTQRQELIAFLSSVKGPVAGVAFCQFLFDIENPSAFDYALWDRSLEVNLSAPNVTAHELRGKFEEGASFVIVTSTEGFIGSFGASAYACCKAAVHNLVKTLANNFGAAAVRFNAVAAGWIGGVMDTDEVFNMSRRITPLGRLGRPEEIAAVCWFLLSQESSFVNGSTVTADGGYSGVDTIAKFEFESSQGADR
jgi:NAD(P)-dependent dehydrogenase (short-subunit alcohol dehydrogenase family)